jgi:hypothetical protein
MSAPIERSSPSNRDEAIEKAKELLTQREREAYAYFCNSKQAPLAPSLNAKLFQLFLNGKTTSEIHRLNPALSLGQIVGARIEGRWDERRIEHLDQLLDQTSLRVQQVTLETADFVCDLFAVANREHGDRLRRYIQSGDEKELGDFRITSLSTFKTAVEILQKLTGQERQSQQKIVHSGIVTHASDPILSVGRPPAAAEAASALKLLLGRKEN